MGSHNYPFTPILEEGMPTQFRLQGGLQVALETPVTHFRPISGANVPMLCPAKPAKNRVIHSAL